METEGSLGQTAQDSHLDSHTAPELIFFCMTFYCFMYDFSVALISALALLKYGNLGMTVAV